jgi:hypothetical protein
LHQRFWCPFCFLLYKRNDNDCTFHLFRAGAGQRTSRSADRSALTATTSLRDTSCEPGIKAACNVLNGVDQGSRLSSLSNVLG